MMKHRGLFLGLGLVALFSLSAREVNAAPMTLVVELNNVVVFSINGSADNQAVTANTTNLNNAMGTSGYVWSGLSGSSNFPGDNTVGGFVTTNGNVSFQGGTGGTLTIIVFESGFTGPASGAGNDLQSTSAATITGADSSSLHQETGTFTDSASNSVSLVNQQFNGGTSAAQSDTQSTGLNPWVGSYTLMNTTVLNLATGSANSPSNNVFTATTSVLPAGVPEPASLIMMVTGMPLPLVVMGLLRRRRAAA
jgi:hypothetical protein